MDRTCSSFSFFFSCPFLAGGAPFPGAYEWPDPQPGADFPGLPKEATSQNVLLISPCPIKRLLVAQIKGQVGTSLCIHRDIFSFEAVPLKTCMFVPVMKSLWQRKTHFTVVLHLVLVLQVTSRGGLVKSLYRPGLMPHLRWLGDFPKVTFSKEWSLKHWFSRCYVRYLSAVHKAPSGRVTGPILAH